MAFGSRDFRQFGGDGQPDYGSYFQQGSQMPGATDATRSALNRQYASDRDNIASMAGGALNAASARDQAFAYAKAYRKANKPSNNIIKNVLGVASMAASFIPGVGAGAAAAMRAGGGALLG